MTLTRRTIARAIAPLDSPPAVPTRGDHDLNAADPPLPAEPLKPAAVLVALVDRPSGWTVLLTRRTDHLRDHAGQVSFPGGRLEPEDDGPIAAALRESEEEIGLDRQHVEVVGYLAGYRTVTRYAVTPVVGFVRPGFRLRLEDFEVADAFEVPLAFFLDPSTAEIHSLERDGRTRYYFVFDYEERYIWGATAGMLVDLADRLPQIPSAAPSVRGSVPTA